MKSLADCLTTAGQQTNDQNVVMSVSNGLGIEYDHVVMLVTSREDDITINEVQYLLMAQEQRLERITTAATLDLTNAAANVATQNNQRFNRGRGNQRGVRGRGPPRQRVYCQLCGKSGHIVSMCYKRFDNSFSRLSLN
ncbi:hypothetical protein ACOSP7_032524 [Xanthoceras sorbifolium]